MHAVALVAAVGTGAAIVRCALPARPRAAWPRSPLHPPPQSFTPPHMVKQPWHLTSMKKELGEATRRWSLCFRFSSSAGGLSRSMSHASTCRHATVGGRRSVGSQARLGPRAHTKLGVRWHRPPASAGLPAGPGHPDSVPTRSGVLPEPLEAMPRLPRHARRPCAAMLQLPLATGTPSGCHGLGPLGAAQERHSPVPRHFRAQARWRPAHHGDVLLRPPLVLAIKEAEPGAACEFLQPAPR